MRFLGPQALSAVLLSCALVAAPSLAAAQGHTSTRDPRELAPAALLGVWKADIAASTYANPPREHFRSFQYTADGKVMVHFGTLNAKGESSHGHWSLQLDGTPGYEYLSSNGSLALAEIRLTKVDEYNLNLTNSTHGTVKSTAAYKLSPDGDTLTITRNPTSPNPTKIVYRRWAAAAR